MIRTGASRTTDDGQRVALAATPGVRAGAKAQNDPQTECPPGLGCEWVPAPYQQLDPSDPTSYGNHDLGDRPKSQEIRYIVIHDTETDWPTALQLAQDAAITLAEHDLCHFFPICAILYRITYFFG